MTTNLLVRLRPLPVIGQGMLRFAFITAKIFRAALSQKLEGRAQISRCASEAGGRPCQRYRLAEQEDRYRVRAANLARLASEENATTESGRRSGDAGLVRRGKWLGASGEAYRA